MVELTVSTIMALLVIAAAGAVLGYLGWYAYNQKQIADAQVELASLQAAGVLQGGKFGVVFNRPVTVVKIGYGYYNEQTGQEFGFQWMAVGKSGQAFQWDLGGSGYNATYVIADLGNGVYKVYRWHFVQITPQKAAQLSAAVASALSSGSSGSVTQTITVTGSSGNGGTSSPTSTSTAPTRSIVHLDVYDTYGAVWYIRSSISDISGYGSAYWQSVYISGTSDTLSARILSDPAGYTCTITPNSQPATAGGYYKFTVSCTQTTTTSSSPTSSTSSPTTPTQYYYAYVTVRNDNVGARWTIQSSVDSISGTSDVTNMPLKTSDFDWLMATISSPPGYTCTISPTGVGTIGYSTPVFTVNCIATTTTSPTSSPTSSTTTSTQPPPPTLPTLPPPSPPPWSPPPPTLPTQPPTTTPPSTSPTSPTSPTSSTPPTGTRSTTTTNNGGGGGVSTITVYVTVKSPNVNWAVYSSIASYYGYGSASFTLKAVTGDTLYISGFPYGCTASPQSISGVQNNGYYTFTVSCTTSTQSPPPSPSTTPPPTSTQPPPTTTQPPTGTTTVWPTSTRPPPTSPTSTTQPTQSTTPPSSTTTYTPCNGYSIGVRLDQSGNLLMGIVSWNWCGSDPAVKAHGRFTWGQYSDGTWYVSFAADVWSALGRVGSGGVQSDLKSSGSGAPYISPSDSWITFNSPLNSGVVTFTATVTWQSYITVYVTVLGDSYGASWTISSSVDKITGSSNAFSVPLKAKPGDTLTASVSNPSGYTCSIYPTSIWSVQPGQLYTFSISCSSTTSSPPSGGSGNSGSSGGHGGNTNVGPRHTAQ